MQINPYLIFEGQCETAMRFYEKCLGGKIAIIMTYGESPAAQHTPPEMAKQIIHATLAVGDFQLQASDCPPDKYQKPQGFSVALQLKDVAKAESVFKALADGGSVTMQFGKTFWSPGFGVLTDRFGIPWMVNCNPAS